MNSTEWIIIFLVFQIIYFLSTWKLFIKAGEKPIYSLIPFYNLIIMMKIIKRPKWWFILLFIPVINLLMAGVIIIETLRSFGKNSNLDTLIGLVSLGTYITYINYFGSIDYVRDRDVKNKTWIGEFIHSLIFAVVAATIVHNYFIQPYIIPTGSLEKTLLIGDFLFVSKFHYGARVPTTPIAFPMVHDTIPIIKKRSYLKFPQLPYLRLPGFQKIKRNEIVVFSWPADTVRRFFVREKGVKKPIDKKSNYVKRCVGLPGDSLEIINGYVHIDNKKNILPDRAKIQFTYKLYNSNGISSIKLIQNNIENFSRKFKINNISQSIYNSIKNEIIGVISNDSNNFIVLTNSTGFPKDLIRKFGINAVELLETSKELTLSVSEYENLKKLNLFDSISQQVYGNKSYLNTFPNDISYKWNEDNFGPILIPKKGMKVKLTVKNIFLYKKIIKDYEKNILSQVDNAFYINGIKSDTYTFKKDYYWMMGDNRHKSEDSRFWGFVPDDHIVGKPVLIWFSIKGINDGIKNWKIRWSRLMTTVKGEGKPISFFPYFILSIILWQIIVFVNKKKIK
ncbi:MAG: signal peptidase I [Flavobacteriaceae bacterium]